MRRTSDRSVRRVLHAVPVLLLTLALAVFLGCVSSDHPWMAVGLFAALAAIVALVSSGTALVLTVFVVMPFINMLWFASADVGGVSLNAQSLLSVAIFAVGLLTIALRHVVLPHKLALPAALFVVANVVAVLVTPNVLTGVSEFTRIVCGLPLVFAVPALVKELPSPRRLLHLFMAAMAVVNATVLLQPLGLLAYTSFDMGGIQRATGFYYHPWDVARYLVVAVPLLLALMDERSASPTAHWVYRTLLLMMLAVTFFTYLKALWVAILAEVVLWLFLSRRPIRGTVVLVLAAAVVAFPARDFIVTVFGDLARLADPLTRGQALSGRVTIWETYIATLRRSSGVRLVFGQGFAPEGLVLSGHKPHNDYLRLLVVNGVFGLAAYGALMVAVFRSLARAVNTLRRQGGLEWRIGIAVQCMFVAYLLMSLTADPSTYPSITLYLWLLLGLVLGYARLARERQLLAEVGWDGPRSV